MTGRTQGGVRPVWALGEGGVVFVGGGWRVGWGHLDIKSTDEFGPKYEATCRDYLERNDGGSLVGYFFTKLPMGEHCVQTTAVAIIGTRRVLMVDTSLRLLSVGLLHVFDRDHKMKVESQESGTRILCSCGWEHSEPRNTDEDAEDHPRVGAWDIWRDHVDLARLRAGS